MSEDLLRGFGPDRNRSPRGRRPVRGTTRARSLIARQLGDLLKGARQSQRLSQDQLAGQTRYHLTPVSRTAISSIERGINLPGIDALVSLARALQLDPKELVELVDVAKAAPDVRGLAPSEILQLGDDCFWQGDYRGAVSYYTVLSQELDGETKPTAETRRMRCRVRINQAVALARLQALRAAKSVAERAVEEASTTPDLQADALLILSSIYSQEGLIDLGLLAVGRAEQLAGEGADRLNGRVRVQKGAILYLAKRYEDARQEFLIAKKLASAAGDFHHVIRAEGNIGACYAKLGKNREATRRFIRCIELARKHDDTVKEASWLVELGVQYFKARNLSEAEQCGRSALILARRLENHGIIFRAEWLLHRVARINDPSDGDVRRLNYLKRLYSRVKNHKDLEELDDFRAQVIEGEAGRA